MKIIELTHGNIALVDDTDYDYLMQWKWHTRFHKTKILYAGRTAWKDGKFSPILMHRIIMNVDDSKIQIDHKDHDGLNNQKYNLRICTRQQNLQNTSSRLNASSKYLGVSFDKKTSKWAAKICNNEKHLRLGSFFLEEDAARAYDAKAKELHGDFANLNFK
jgi:hypothetical protein